MTSFGFGLPGPSSGGTYAGSLTVYVQVRWSGRFGVGSWKANVVWNFGSPNTSRPARMANGLSHGTYTRNPPTDLVCSIPRTKSPSVIGVTRSARDAGYARTLNSTSLH